MRAISILILLTILFSCKKEKIKATNEVQPLPAIYGNLFTTKYDVLTGNTITSSGGFSNAYFSSQGITNYSVVSGSYQDVGNVSLNGVTFKKNTSGSIIYTDTTYASYIIPEIWSVQGNSSIPSFTFSLDFSHQNYFPIYEPTYTGYSDIPDTIFLAKNNSIRISSSTCATTTEISLTSGSSTINEFVGPTSHYTFTPTELVNFPPTTNGSVSVKISYSRSQEVVTGKYFVFYSCYLLTKKNVVFK